MSDDVTITQPRAAWWCRLAAEIWERYEQARDEEDRAGMVAALRAYDKHTDRCLDCRGCGRAPVWERLHSDRNP